VPAPVESPAFAEPSVEGRRVMITFFGQEGAYFHPRRGAFFLHDQPQVDLVPEGASEGASVYFVLITRAFSAFFQFHRTLSLDGAVVETRPAWRR